VSPCCAIVSAARCSASPWTIISLNKLRICNAYIRRGARKKARYRDLCSCSDASAASLCYDLSNIACALVWQQHTLCYRIMPFNNALHCHLCCALCLLMPRRRCNSPYRAWAGIHTRWRNNCTFCLHLLSTYSARTHALTTCSDACDAALRWFVTNAWRKRRFLTIIPRVIPT